MFLELMDKAAEQRLPLEDRDSTQAEEVCFLLGIPP